MSRALKLERQINALERRLAEVSSALSRRENPGELRFRELKQPNGIGVGAYLGRKRVGHVRALWHRITWLNEATVGPLLSHHPEYSRNSQVLIVGKSWLDPSVRGSGNGVRLYEAMMEIAKKHTPEPFVFASEASWIGSGTSSAAERVWNALARRHPWHPCVYSARSATQTRCPPVILVGAERAPNPDEHLSREEYEGRRGEERHMTAQERGHIAPGRLAGLPGARGEHELFARSPTGAKGPQAWDELVESIREGGVEHAVLVVVEPHSRRRGRLVIPEGPQIAEGNHRVRAAIEAGAPTVPVEIRYFGKAEERWTVAPGVQRRLTPFDHYVQACFDAAQGVRHTHPEVSELDDLKAFRSRWGDELRWSFEEGRRPHRFVSEYL